MRRARRKREITEGNNRDELGLAVKAVVYQDVLQLLCDCRHPMHNLTLDRVGKIRDQTGGHAGAHSIAVLPTQPAEKEVNELVNMWRDSRINCADETVQDEESAVHDFAKLLEDVDCQIDEQIKHLVIDSIIANAHQTWLQRAA